MLQQFCAGLISEMQSGELMVFNNKQVTCVGARVMGISHDRRATMRQIFYKIDLEQGSALS
jgi:hypothetical protein